MWLHSRSQGVPAMISVLVLPLVVQSQFDTFVARVGMEAMGLDNPASSSPQETIQPQLMEDSNQISNPGNLVLAQVKTGITSQRAVAQLKRQLSQATEDEAKKAHVIQMLATSLQRVQTRAKSAVAQNQQLKALAMRLSAQSQQLQAAAQDQNQKRMSSNEHLEAKLRSLEAQSTQLEAQQTKLKAENDHLELSKEQLERGNERLKTQQDSLKKSDEHLQSVQGTLKAGNEHLASQQKSLTLGNTRLEKQQETLKVENERLQSQEKQADATTSMLVHEAKSQHETLKSENEQLMAHLQADTEQVGRLKAENEQLGSLQVSLKSESEHLQTQIGESKSDIEHLDSQRGSLKAENDGLEAQAKSWKAEIEKLRSEQNSLKSENAQLESEKQSLTTEKSTSGHDESSIVKKSSTQDTEEVKQLRSTVATLQTENQQLHSKEKSFTQEVQQLKSAEATLQTENQQLKADAAPLETENQQLETENQQLKADKAPLETENEHLKSKEASLEGENNRLRASVKAILQSAQKRTSALQAELNTVKGSAVSDSSHKSTNTQSSGALQVQVKALNQEVTSKDDELKALREELKKRDQELQQYKAGKEKASVATPPTHAMPASTKNIQSQHSKAHTKKQPQHREASPVAHQRTQPIHNKTQIGDSDDEDDVESDDLNAAKPVVLLSQSSRHRTRIGDEIDESIGATADDREEEASHKKILAMEKQIGNMERLGVSKGLLRASSSAMPADRAAQRNHHTKPVQSTASQDPFDEIAPEDDVESDDLNPAKPVVLLSQSSRHRNHRTKPVQSTASQDPFDEIAPEDFTPVDVPVASATQSSSLLDDSEGIPDPVDAFAPAPVVKQSFIETRRQTRSAPLPRDDIEAFVAENPLLHSAPPQQISTDTAQGQTNSDPIAAFVSEASGLQNDAHTEQNTEQTQQSLGSAETMSGQNMEQTQQSLGSAETMSGQNMQQTQQSLGSAETMSENGGNSGGADCSTFSLHSKLVGNLPSFKALLGC